MTPGALRSAGSGQKVVTGNVIWPVSQTAGMTELEERIVALLSSAAECLAHTQRHWSGMMRNAANQGEFLFKREAEVKTKFEFVKSIEGYYGGMGSFNDISIPNECGNLHSDLYTTIRDLLRAYWCELDDHAISLGEFPTRSTFLGLSGILVALRRILI